VSPRKYPPLCPREVIKILTARGFRLLRTKGDHRYYHCRRGGRDYLVTVDMGVEEYGPALMKSMIRQSGMTREEFYCTTKRTAKKIGKRPARREELATWMSLVE